MGYKPSSGYRPRRISEQEKKVMLGNERASNFILPSILLENSWERRL
jgi:hypothetical protein